MFKKQFTIRRAVESSALLRLPGIASKTNPVKLMWLSTSAYEYNGFQLIKIHILHRCQKPGFFS